MSSLILYLYKWVDAVDARARVEVKIPAFVVQSRDEFDVEGAVAAIQSRHESKFSTSARIS